LFTVLRPVISRALAFSQRLPTPVQDIALSAYGAFFHHLRYGAEFKRARAALDASERWSRERIEAEQQRNLTALLRHCRRNVPYYEELFLRSGISENDLGRPDVLTLLPALDKATVRANPDSFLARGASRWKLVAKGTAGTTGSPMLFYSTRDEIQRYWAFADRCRTWAGSRLGARRATFSGIALLRGDQQEPPFWRRDRIENKVLLSIYHLSPRTIPHYARFLEGFRPAEILGHPSALSLVAAIWPDDIPVTFPPPAIITSGEQLFANQRAIIERRFGGRVSDQYSAGGEMGPVISNCERGVYHEHPESGIVELMRPEGDGSPEGERGEIVITGFTNWTMPLLRYRTGDASQRRLESCACGRDFRAYEFIEGKIADRLLLPDGRMIGNVYSLVESFPAVRECQIRQEAVDRVVFVLAPSPEFDAAARAEIERQAREFLGPAVQISIELVDSIARTKRGKLRLVVSELTETPLVEFDRERV